VKQKILLFALILGMTALTACVPKPEEVNAVVESFWEHWKAGNADKMADLMTDTVEMGIMMHVTSAEVADKGIPGSDLAEFLVTELPLATYPGVTFSIKSTELFEKYAIVETLISADPDFHLAIIFHLQSTDDGWKISFMGLTSTT